MQKTITAESLKERDLAHVAKYVRSAKYRCICKLVYFGGCYDTLTLALELGCGLASAVKWFNLLPIRTLDGDQDTRRSACSTVALVAAMRYVSTQRGQNLAFGISLTPEYVEQVCSILFLSEVGFYNTLRWAIDTKAGVRDARMNGPRYRAIEFC